MATESTEGQGQRSFADFVRESPQLTEFTSGGGGGSTSVFNVVGTVARTEREDTFILGLVDGSLLELRNEVVQSFDVVQENPQLVSLKVDPNALRQFPPKVIRGIDEPKHPTTDPINTLKEPLNDWNTGQEDFALSVTNKTGPNIDPINTFKEMWTDGFNETGAFLDNPNTGVVDTLIENTNTGLADLQIFNTIAEVTTPNPQNLTFPQNVGQIPFVMATPHQAPAAAAMMRNLSANLSQNQLQGGGAALKGATTDTLMGPITTLKELTKDIITETLKEPHKDPLLDPNTWVETGGTLMENVGWSGIGPVWNFPGLMF